MAGIFKKKTTKRTKYTISPSEAGKIFEQEFETKDGLNVKNKLIISPEPFFFKFKYTPKEDKQDDRKSN